MLCLCNYTYQEGSVYYQTRYSFIRARGRPRVRLRPRRYRCIYSIVIEWSHIIVELKDMLRKIFFNLIVWPFT